MGNPLSSSSTEVPGVPTPYGCVSKPWSACLPLAMLGAGVSAILLTLGLTIEINKNFMYGCSSTGTAIGVASIILAALFCSKALRDYSRATNVVSK